VKVPIVVCYDVARPFTVVVFFVISILDRHIARTTSAAIIVVLLAMLSLLSIFAYIEELQEHHAGYTAWDAMLYVLLTLPRRFLEILPYSLFLGVLIGMGTLSTQNEITVMRAAGMSAARLFASLLMPLTLWILSSYLVSEVIAPIGERQAEVRKVLTIHGEDGALNVMGGHWFRDDELFIKIDAIDDSGNLAGVTQYWLDEHRQLREIVASRRAWFDSQDGGGWRLEDLTITRWQDGEITVERRRDGVWENDSTPEFIESQVFVDPAKMSVGELTRQIDYARSQGLGDIDYRLAFWSKVLQPLSIFGLALLAVIFTVGALREVGIGARMVTGIMVGLGFKYLQDLFAPMSVVYGLAPFAAVALPIAVCWVVGLAGARRIS